MIGNRLLKNYKKLATWAKRSHVEAYRLYDRDIPEFPFIVDIYGDFFVIYDKSIESIDKEKGHFQLIIQAVQENFIKDSDKIIIKQRERQSGLNQYEKLDQANRSIVIHENQAKFKVNLWDYLDTGLFLDHRPMRQIIYKESKGKKFLNLFSYVVAFP